MSDKFHVLFVKGDITAKQREALTKVGMFAIGELSPHVGKNGGVGRTFNNRNAETSIGTLNLSANMYLTGSTKKGGVFDAAREKVTAQTANKQTPKQTDAEVAAVEQTIASILGG